jgi:hypothetical protein
MVVVAVFAASAAGGYDHRDAAADEIGCKRRQLIVLIFRPTVFNRPASPAAAPAPPPATLPRSRAPR